MSPRFPFSAVVGHDSLKTALIVNAVDPSIGGVLVHGPRGTGKSTVIRAFAGLLPSISAVAGCPFHCPPEDPAAMHDGCQTRWEAGEELEAEEIPAPFVEVPLNATEDRLAGSLHLEQTLQQGRRHFEPGLLAEANRGVLYIDEVNLLADHLVDMLLDAAAFGENVVEREGVSARHPSRFLLIGSMNPEEGELRPQLTDRFGLCVRLSDLTDADDRLQVLERRLAFDSDPESFARSFDEAERTLSASIADARARLSHVTLPEAERRAIVAIAAHAGVEGMRTDIAMAKTAAAMAAFTEAPAVTHRMVQEAARLALPHRLPASAVPAPDHDQDPVETILLEAEGRPGRPVPADEVDDYAVDPEMAEAMQGPGAAAAGSILLTYLNEKKKKQPTTQPPIGTPPG
jgi:Mg-chelatase subunit ChlI